MSSDNISKISVSVNLMPVIIGFPLKIPGSIVILFYNPLPCPICLKFRIKEMLLIKANAPIHITNEKCLHKKSHPVCQGGSSEFLKYQFLIFNYFL